MDIANSALLMEFYNNIDIFMAVFVRLLGFFVILPIFSGQNIPMEAKIGVSLGIAILAYTNGSVTIVQYDYNIFGFFVLILKEFITGFTIGFVVYMMFSIMYFVGQLVDFQIGFSMVSVFDPVSQIQAPITGNLYYLIICVFFIQTGTLNSFIYTMFESFKLIPLGEANIVGNDKLITYVIQMMIDYFEIGVKIALPVVGTIVVLDVILGILVKAVPQMNIFVVGMPIKVFVGFILLFLLMPLLVDIYDYILNDLLLFMMNMLKGMEP